MWKSVALLGGGILAAAWVISPSHAQVLSSGDGHKVDVGLNAPISVPPGEPLSVAFFIATAANVYVQAMVDEAEKLSEEHGFDLEVFDAQFNAQIQMDQLENALQSGRFNAWYVTPIDGNLMCDIVTKDAAAADILVATSNIAICGRDELPFAEQWEPGIVTYVGAAETIDYISGWMEAIVTDRGDEDTRALLIKGFAGLTVTNAIESAAAEIGAQDNGFTVVGEAYGDFTAADAQAKIETLLLAHPDANTVISSYSDMTIGAINALEDAGRLDEVAVYDIGAGQDSVPLIADGQITASAIFAPRTHVRQSLGALIDAWSDGTMAPRVQSGLFLGEPDTPHMVTAENVSTYTPEY